MFSWLIVKPMTFVLAKVWMRLISAAGVGIAICPKSQRLILVSARVLISASESVQNTVRSEWHWKWGDMDLDIVLVQSAAHGFMPILVEFTDRQPKYKNFFSETHIEWKKQNGLWVPIRINAATVENAILPQPTNNQNLVKIDWLVGDEVTDEFLQPDAPDHRAPLMNAFGRYYDVVVDGKTVTGDPWDRPEDLEIEVAKKSMEKRQRNP